MSLCGCVYMCICVNRCHYERCKSRQLYFIQSFDCRQQEAERGLHYLTLSYDYFRFLNIQYMKQKSFSSPSDYTLNNMNSFVYQEYEF